MCKECEIIHALEKGEQAVFDGVNARVTVYRNSGKIVAYCEDKNGMAVSEVGYKTYADLAFMMKQWGKLEEWVIVDPYKDYDDSPILDDVDVLELMENEWIARLSEGSEYE